MVKSAPRVIRRYTMPKRLWPIIPVPALGRVIAPITPATNSSLMFSYGYSSSPWGSDLEERRKQDNER